MGVMETRRRILLNQPHLIDASGNPISFSTDMAAKMGVKAYFSPVQEGSGDPSPSNVRPITGWNESTLYHGGENLLNASQADLSGRLATNGSIYQADSGYYTSPYINVAQGETYIKNSPQADAYHRWCTYNSNKVCIRAVSDSNEIKIETGEQYIRMCGEQTELSSTYVVSGAEYPVTFPAVGKNLFDKDAVTNGAVWWKGALVQGYNDYSASDKIPVIPGETYTLIRNSTGQSAVCFFDAEGVYGSQVTDWNNFYPTWTIPSGVYFIAFSVVKEDVGSVMMNKGSTALPYEPFTNTLYGGYVDYEKGEVVANMGLVKLNGTEDWKINSAITNGYYYANTRSYPTSTYLLSDKYVSTQIQGSQMVAGQMKKASTNINFCTGFATLQAWKEELAENNVELVFELRNPIHYPLTPTLIKSLKGANTIWSDLNGNVDLKYWKH